MASTRNTPNKAAAGPKATGSKAPAKKAPAKKAPAKKAAPAKAAPAAEAPRAAAAPVPTKQVEVRVGGKLVALVDCKADSVKVQVANGKLTVAGTTADAVDEPEPELGQVDPAIVRASAHADPPTGEEFDAMVAGAVPPNQAVQFEADPRVNLQIHEGATVAEKR